MNKPLTANYFKHFIFTNFGVGIRDEVWLTYRLEIFLNTVFPSLSNQTSQDFEWIIFIDQSLPKIHAQRLQNAIDHYELNARLVRVEDYSLVNDEVIRMLHHAQPTTLLTSRIDDDDCIHSRVIELIQRKAIESSDTEKILVISLKNGLEFLPSDQCYREVTYETLALALTLVDKTPVGRKKSITQYAHHLVIDTLKKQGVRSRHIQITDKTPLYLYTKHPLSDSYFFGARSRIMGDPKRVEGFDERFFAQYGFSAERLNYLVEVLRQSPIGMPHKYLEKLGVIRNQIRAEFNNKNRSSDTELNSLLARKIRYERNAVRNNPYRSSGGKIRVAILGSCVTRDLFELQSKELENFEVCFYMARSSVVSYLGLPCTDPRLNVPGDGFEERRSQWDMTKQHWAMLEQSRPDIILMDFIDERIGLIQHQGSVFSASRPVIKAFERAGIDFEIKRPWSKEVELLRQWSLPGVLDKAYSICQNVVIHKAIWAPHYKDNRGVKQSFSGTEFEKLVELNNNILNRMFDSLENSSTPVEQVGGLEVGLCAGGDHNWPLCPYHYERAYYKTLARQLLARVIL